MIVELEKPTLRHLVQRSFSLYREFPAIGAVNEKPMTYGELKTAVENLSKQLFSAGVRKGDRVVILGDNSPNWVVSYLGVTTMGAVAVPILPGFSDTSIAHILKHSESVAVFASKKFRPKVDGSGLDRIFSLDDLTAEKKGPPDRTSSGSVPTPEPDDLAVIIYTSGTTGNSKGVMLTHRAITTNVVNSIEKFPIDTKDRFLSILPLAHAFEATGGMLCPLAVGVNIHYMQGLPTPQKLLSSMETVKPTGVLTVPLVIDKIYRKRILPQLQSKKLVWALYHTVPFRKLLNRVAGKKLLQSLGGHLRFFMFGGASLNRDVEVFLRDAGILYSTGYGMTETSPILTINPFGKVRVGSCGQPIPGIEIKIQEPDPKTGIGEIIVHGPIVMEGYSKNPEATREVMLEGGWLKTGDLGYFDKDGYLFIKGRSKNVIVGPSGENIYPEIIEQLLRNQPFIQEAVVYQSESKLVAKVCLDAEALDQKFDLKSKNPEAAKPQRAEIMEHARLETNRHLPRHSQVGRILEQVEPFEMTPTNKVKRFLYT